MFTTIAFHQSVDPGGAFTAINAALGEQHVVSLGANINVPELAQLMGAAAGVEVAVESFARLTSPSLRSRATFAIEPFASAAAAAVVPGSPHKMLDLRRNPIPLVVGEVLNAELSSNPVAAQLQWVLAWLSSGVIEPVAGAIFTTRATGATALVASTWTNVPILLAENLPRGRYALVGLRARSATLVASRAVFIGGRWRPGVLGTTAQADIEHPMFRYGQLGSWGEFEDTDLPSFDCLANAADAAQDFYLDLVQLRSGPA